ncbi:MAG: hypothetical protein KF880_02755 [Ferruginibacter sp.]|nr:hypothetical protein [Ferruginibacter sp.]
MKLSLTILWVFFCLTALSQKPGEVITFKKDNYQIDYPASWRLDTSKIMGTSFLLYVPEDEASVNFNENINLLIQDLTGQHMDLDRYKEITDDQLKTLGSDCTVIESAVKRSNNVSFYKTAYSVQQEAERLYALSVCFIQEDNAYLLTFTSLGNSFDKWKDIAEKTMMSFKLHR